MSRALPRRILAGIFLASLLVARAQDIAVGGGGDSSEPAGFRSYGDDRSVNVEAELASLRSNNQGLAGSVTRRPMTF